jgi:monothiol glutaredoxin
LYVSGELLGGADILTEMYQKGELQQALKDAGAV